MTVQNMRDKLSQAYNGASKWVNKVKRMSDQQVIAIYYRMLNAGQLPK